MKIIKYEDKLDNDVSSLPEKKKVTASNLNEIKDAFNNQPIFRKGQIIWFSSKQELLEDEDIAKLVVGADYEVFADGHYIKSGDVAGIGGSDYLQESHLPEIHKLLMASLTPSTPVIGNTDVPSQPRNQVFLPLAANTAFSPGTYYIKLNETGRQDKLDPKHTIVYMVRFLRKIIASDLGE